MKISEIKDMNNEQLKKLVAEKRTQAVKVRFELASRQQKNTKMYRALKTDIARILTVLNERSQQ